MSVPAIDVPPSAQSWEKAPETPAASGWSGISLVDLFFDGWFVYRSVVNIKKFVATFKPPSSSRELEIRIEGFYQSRQLNQIQLGLTSMLGSMIIIKRGLKYAFQIYYGTAFKCSGLSIVIELVKCVVVGWRLVLNFNMQQGVKSLKLFAEEYQIEVVGLEDYNFKLCLYFVRQGASLLYSGARLTCLLTGATIGGPAITILFWIGLIANIWESYSDVPDIKGRLQCLQLLKIESQSTQA